MFGGWDETLLKKDWEGEPMIDWVPVIEDQAYWTFRIDHVSFNGQTISAPNIWYYGITDIGTSLIYLPETLYDAWYNSL